MISREVNNYLTKLYNEDKHACWLVFNGYYVWNDKDCPYTEDTFDLTDMFANRLFISYVEENMTGW